MGWAASVAQFQYPLITDEEAEVQRDLYGGCFETRRRFTQRIKDYHYTIHSLNVNDLCCRELTSIPASFYCLLFFERPWPYFC